MRALLSDKVEKVPVVVSHSVNELLEFVTYDRSGVCIGDRVELWMNRKRGHAQGTVNCLNMARQKARVLMDSGDLTGWVALDRMRHTDRGKRLMPATLNPLERIKREEPAMVFPPEMDADDEESEESEDDDDEEDDGNQRGPREQDRVIIDNPNAKYKYNGQKGYVCDLTQNRLRVLLDDGAKTGYLSHDRVRILDQGKEGALPAETAPPSKEAAPRAAASPPPPATSKAPAEVGGFRCGYHVRIVGGTYVDARGLITRLTAQKCRVEFTDREGGALLFPRMLQIEKVAHE